MELPKAVTEELTLAVSEACSLVLRHSLDPVISLKWQRDGDEICIVVGNSDVLHPASAQQPVSPTQKALIAAVVDEVDMSDFLETGRPLIKMRKRLPVRRIQKQARE